MAKMEPKLGDILVIALTCCLAVTVWAQGKHSAEPARAHSIDSGTESGVPEQEASPTSVSLDDLSFMNGHWTGEWEGGLTDEHWSTPSGDSMMGMFSYVKAGKAVFYEFLLIEQTKSGPVMKLKHFNPGLIGWEEKDQVYSYPLIKFQKNEAVFERPDKLTRLTYRRTSADTLYALLEQFKNGKRSSEGFSYKLAP